MNRKDILNKIVESQIKIINGLKDSVERFKNASNLEENSSSDPEDLSHQAEAKDMQLRYEKMLSMEQQNLAFVQKEMDEVHDIIENGTLLKTDQNYLFIGISVPSFTIDEFDVISFSDDAPIYKEIKDKNIGDEILIGDRKLKIMEIN